MKRVVISCCIILAIISYSIFGILTIKQKNNRLESLLQEILVCYESDNLEEALKKAKNLESEWTMYEQKMSMLVRDDKLQNLNISVARIIPYLDEDNEELEAEIQNIQHQIQMLYRGEFPAWYNIL